MGSLAIKMKKGFTLSEVLITLTVIGVVAGLTIPMFSEKVQDRLLERAQDGAKTKIIEAFNAMGMNNVLVGYTTNEAFADAFQKYMKVSQRCDSSNLTKCFPAKIKSTDGTEIDTSTYTTGSAMNSKNFSVPTVALGLANGTSIILGLRALTGAADDPCLKLDPMSNNRADGSGILSCVSMLYDVNGFNGPNVIGKDISAVNVKLPGSCDGAKVGTLCVDTVDINGYPPDGTYFSHFEFREVGNYWKGAIKVCIEKGMRLPTKDELTTLYDNYKNGGNTAGMNDLYYWSSTEQLDSPMQNFAYFMLFSTGMESSDEMKSKGWVRCVK